MTDATIRETFRDFLARTEDTGLSTDDILAVALPLLYQVQAVHAQRFVAPLLGLDHVYVDDGVLRFDPNRPVQPRTNPTRVAALQVRGTAAVRVVDEVKLDADM